MPTVPTISDILHTAGQLTDCAACLMPLTARTVRTRRMGETGLSPAQKKQVRTSLQAAHDALENALARYRAHCPHPEEGAIREVARLGTLLSVRTVTKRRIAHGVTADPPQTVAAGLVSLSEKLIQQINDCPTLIDWQHPDVMVGSLRSDEQYRINTEKNFYYTPVRVIAPEALPVRYVALCRSASSAEPGIRCFGEVKTIRTIRRNRIPVPTKADNGNDLYYIFPIRSWTPLPTPIAIREEGVYAPRFTNMFLLSHSHATYELFDITSEAAYRLHAALSDLASNSTDDTSSAPVRITDRLTLTLKDDRFVLSDIRTTPVAVLLLSEFCAYPGKSLRALMEAGGLA